MTEIRINHGALDNAAGDMRTAISQIDNRLNDLESELAPLRSDWQGNQQESYRAAKTQWDSAINDLKQLLQETQLATLASNDEYRGADMRGAANFQF